MWYSGTAPQRRVTVVFRIILAIPQFVVLFFLGIAGFFVAVIGWFAALFTGRLPEFAHSYLSGLVRWEIRVNAYLFLLTDQYPPFSLDDVEYPVRPILPGRGPLNRVSVFFRIILAIPAAVFSQIVINGLTLPLLFVMWIVVIVTGRMPPALYTTYSAALRYQTRFHSWFDMLTSEYAWGMFGDFVPAPPASSPPPLGAVAGETPAAPQRSHRHHRHHRRTSLRRSRSRTRRPVRRRQHRRLTPGQRRVRPDGPHRSRRHRSAPPEPCLRPPRGSGRRCHTRRSRCPPGESSSCRVPPSPG
jgi:hypothetical protein